MTEQHESLKMAIIAGAFFWTIAVWWTAVVALKWVNLR